MTIDASRLMAMRSAILEQNSALQRAAGLAGSGQPGSLGGPEATRPGGFGDALQTALRQVNESQAQGAERGSGEVPRLLCPLH